METTLKNQGALDSIADGKSGSVVEKHGFPLSVTQLDFTWVAYVVVPQGTMFKNRNGQFSQYGWVKLEASDSDSLTIMGPKNLWLSVVSMKTTSSPTGHILPEFETTGVIKKDPGLENRLIGIKAAGKDKQDEELQKLVREGYANYVKRVRNAPIKIEEEVPSGVYKKAWLRTNTEPPEKIRTDKIRQDVRGFLSSLKEPLDIKSKFDKADEGIYKYGNLECQDAESRFVDSKGNIIERKTPLVQWGGVKSIEYPFTKPNAFKLSRKRFNKLMEDTPSTLLQPLKTWVEAVGDVEEYAIGMVLAIYKMTNILGE